MTQEEALRMALEALEADELDMVDDGSGNMVFRKEQAITAIKKALAQPEQDNTYIYASSLAKTIWQKHYIKESPKFALLDTTEGVLTQIDNMTCGLVREKPAQPEQEPVKDWIASHNEICALLRQAHDALALTSYPPQRTWVGLTDDEITELQHEIKVRLMGTYKTEDIYRAIEAKLKAKNEHLEKNT